MRRQADNKKRIGDKADAQRTRRQYDGLEQLAFVVPMVGSVCRDTITTTSNVAFEKPVTLKQRPTDCSLIEQLGCVVLVWAQDSWICEGRIRRKDSDTRNKMCERGRQPSPSNLRMNDRGFEPWQSQSQDFVANITYNNEDWDMEALRPARCLFAAMNLTWLGPQMVPVQRKILRRLSRRLECPIPIMHSTSPAWLSSQL
ncbi:uncharacterized protein ASPGLDRAFT_22183 [Aspergillus glaucus CBS 516.65]|uniref:Uncharacterized protein n=1 Tax=Aspergillus glaucus CBS 516.65 TaxID=1160497 RepID=A0A1L9VXT8_ASPGL|nr:hypothetical protein ASPGLDRAFT_22183 [Aspergillus glaucus CBS 516.65]OJJ88699.1 hypothetical protein ASPGLDRAFT_22183 [Aspergillus glaucus CBS 516.65]